MNLFEYSFCEMTEEAAQRISKWSYPAPYDIYSFTDCDAERDELMNGLHFAAYMDCGGSGRAAGGKYSTGGGECCGGRYENGNLSDAADGKCRDGGEENGNLNGAADGKCRDNCEENGNFNGAAGNSKCGGTGGECCGEDEPCGFTAIGWSAQIQDRKLRFIYDDESYTDIAFGLRPDLCGKGLGKDFVTSAIEFVRSLFKDDGIRLTVDSDNIRGLKLYKKLGFREIYSFSTTSVDAAHGRPLHMKIMVL